MTDSDIERLAQTLAAHVDNLQRYAYSLSESLEGMYMAQEAQILRAIDAALASYAQTRDLSYARIRLLRKLRELLRKLRQECCDEMVAHVEGQIRRLAANENQFNIAWILLLFSLMGQNKPKVASLSEESLDDVRKYGTYNGETVADVYARILSADIDRVYRAFCIAVMGDAGPEEAESGIQRAMSITLRQIKLNTAGIVNGVSNDIASLVAGRNGRLVQGVMWVTALDERVCDECAANEGVVFPAGQAACPLHANCRCHLVPVTEEVAEEMQEDE